MHIDVASRRLGSPLEPLVELYDDNGQRIATQLYRAGSDPILALHVPKTGRYRINARHLGFQGGPHYVYRATVSTQPYVPFVYPSGGQPARLRLRSVLLGVERAWSLCDRLDIPQQATTDQWIRSSNSLNPDASCS